MPEQDAVEGGRSKRSRRPHRTPAEKALKLFDGAAGVLLCLLAVAAPWMFGATEAWSVRVMNIGCFALGAILAAVFILDRCARGDNEAPPSSRWSKVLGALFFASNVLVLAFCAVALVNARASFSMEDLTFNYNDSYNPSLPTTYDARLTRQTLIDYSACFIMFWSARYWLGRGWRRVLRERREDPTMLANARFRLLMWVIALNGLALAVQGTLQRVSGSSKLLWFRNSWWGTPSSCFGPFSYRGNAAEYLNLIWPVTLAFWWILTRERKRSHPARSGIADGPELLLIPGFVITALASFLTLSRGGAAIAAGSFLGLLGLMLWQRVVSWRGFALIMIIGGGVVGGALVLAGESLNVRLRETERDQNLGGRAEIYINAQQIASDYPVYGAGPGAFRSVYYLYRTETKQAWHGFLHDDWLETRVTFGRVGFGFLIANLVLLFAWMLSPGRPLVPTLFLGAGVISLGGALAHAKFDFPFQTYSIFFMFILLAAVLTTGSRAQKAG